MATTLRIGFSGLCLFVPDPKDPAGPRLHVLLINHGSNGSEDHGSSGEHGNHGGHAGHGGNGHPKHYAIFYVDRNYTRPNSQEESGFPVGVLLDGRALVLGNPSSMPIAKTTAMLGSDILDLTQVSTAGKLPRKYLGNNPGPIVAARVTLTSGTEAQNPGASLWNVTASNGSPLPARRIANEARWSIPDISNGILTIRFMDLKTGQLAQTLDLHPIDGRIRINICCLPEEELPGGPLAPQPQIGAPADHFEAFFDLFPNVEPPKLTLKALSKTAHTETCTTAQVPPDDEE